MSPEAKRGPVSPAEAEELRRQAIPAEVFEVFNELIAQNISDGQARVLQETVVNKLEARGLNRGEIFARHWLDVEEIYTEAGWRVTYDRPVYYAGEDFEAYFEFQANSG